MRETELQLQIGPFQSGTVTNAHKLKLLREAIGHATHHVGNARASRAPLGAGVTGFVTRRNSHFTVLELHFHSAICHEAQFAKFALGLYFLTADGNFHATWNRDWVFTNTRHVSVIPS